MSFETQFNAYAYLVQCSVGKNVDIYKIFDKQMSLRVC